LLWLRRTTTVERLVVQGEGRLSMSLHADEVTILATTGGVPPTVVDSCTDLELGAHVARMRATRR
jgi:hypothetical protein